MKQFLFVFALLFACVSAFAYQVADGAPPSLMLTGKYIFYWGKHQCDLSEATLYKGELNLTAPEFRQMLVDAPKVWNGKGLMKIVNFKLEGLTVSSTEYLNLLEQLDAKIAVRASPGAVLHLTDLTLEERINGSIDINIEKEDAGKSNVLRGYSPFQGNVYLNEQFLDRAVWGREDIYETSDRDYFTVREFWQTIRQEPVVDWKFYLTPQTIRSDINFTSKDKTTFSVVARLQEGEYRVMLDNLEAYRYMVHPGAIVTLQLQTAEQYDLLYKKVMNIVADDDPRLRLRRKRDQHKLSIQWGDWSEKINDLYLTRLTTPQGESLIADAPVARTSALSFADEKKKNWGATAPTCTIDDEPVSGDISLRVTVSDSLVFHISSRQYEQDSITDLFSLKGLNITSLLFDSIQIEGYALPPMSFSIYLSKIRSPLLVRNEFNMLKLSSENPSKAVFHEVKFNKDDLVFRFDLPEKSSLVFSVFEPDGWLSFEEDNTFVTGTNTITVPRFAFRNKGKHIAFLNTTVGVTKLEFVVE